MVARWHWVEREIMSRQPSIWALAWERWKILSELLGDAQARLVMFIFYFTVVLPFGLAVTLFSDALRIRRTPQWLAREAVSEQFEDARRQF
jgi:hypothetical protein